MTWFPGEVEALHQVLRYGEQFGYGHLIAHLKRAWALRLMASSPGLSYEQALLAADADAFPQAAEFVTGEAV